MIGAAESELADYKHGVNTPNDIPSMLSVAVAYEFIPVLRASVEYHFFDDKNAGMANGKQKFLTKGTNEYLAGIEWDVTKQLTVSCGVQITDCLTIIRVIPVSLVILILWALEPS